MAAVLVLQVLPHYSDRETAEAVRFDVRWKRKQIELALAKAAWRRQLRTRRRVLRRLPGAPARAGLQAAANSVLALVLGPRRAAALRALRRPLTIGELAAAVQCAPTTATYHVHHLAAAGMVTRERRGSSVLVSRTASGGELGRPAGRLTRRGQYP